MLLASAGIGAVWLTFAGCLLIAGLLAWWLGIETKSANLERVSEVPVEGEGAPRIAH